MAKGPNLGSSRHERLLGSFSHSQDQETSTDVSELDEDDVWSMVDDMVDRDDHGASTARSYRALESNGDRAIQGRRWLARGKHQAGGLSLAFDNARKTQSPSIVHQFHPQENMATSCSRHMATSAPVNVPDWSRNFQVDSVESSHDSDDDVLESRDSERIPPHEYLAREYGRSHKTAATSVFEGVGRTLKGRDLSRVRDAVWSQTGFDG
ncbi:hypothetical protein HHK36_005637 [Tetracentron sinense]|uniref:Senescence regulator n=1 Tax=Tetracentron sinense TaxID=13715 RepID=A0A834ZKY8_TETSI|nr:hypothetical protein HHK36_005637 [Tetracentron sinense]